MELMKEFAVLKQRQRERKGSIRKCSSETPAAKERVKERFV